MISECGRRGIAILVVLVGTLFANVVAAEDWSASPRPPAKGVHEHDGFLLRAALGFGYESLSFDDATIGSTTIGGPGASFDLALGGVVTSNLAVNADLFSSVVVSPSVTVDGSDIGDAQNTTLSLSGLGVGVTYYFMPINIYLAGSLGIGQAGITEQGTDYGSDVGFATNLMVGKEFWVADDWGIGFAGQLLYCSVPRADIDATMPYIGFNLLFSVTYN